MSDNLFIFFFSVSCRCCCSFLLNIYSCFRMHFEGTRPTRTEIEPALNSVPVSCRLLPARLPHREIKADVVVAIVETIRSRRHNLLNLTIYHQKMSTEIIYHRNRKPLRLLPICRPCNMTRHFGKNISRWSCNRKGTFFSDSSLSWSFAWKFYRVIVVACFYVSLDVDNTNVSKTVDSNSIWTETLEQST